MLIDLHSHSTASDGTDSPADLVAKGVAAGLGVLGITDHDTFGGWDEALAAAADAPLELVCGVEISCRLGEYGVHLLAYEPDRTDRALGDELARIRAGRTGRVPAMVEALRPYGVELEVGQVGGGESPGRPHVADALVAGGYAQNRQDAFARWLEPGKPGYVTRYAPEPAQVIRLVRSAGGIPVLAHPRGRDSAPAVSDQVITELAEAGLVGLEVDHHDHPPAVREALRTLARRLDLVVTGSSDHHGLGKVGHALGSERTDPEQYDRLLERRVRS